MPRYTQDVFFGDDISSSVAAVVYGDLVVVGTVIEVQPEEPTEPHLADPPQNSPQWVSTLKDTWSNNIGSCGINLLVPGLAQHIRCHNCSFQTFMEHRLSCCTQPGKSLPI